jgi:hypothetical protein
MAGLSGKQTLVDVVAASEALVPSQLPPEPEAAGVVMPEVLAPMEQAATEMTAGDSAACMFGHANTPGAQFCASCGISMDATKTGPAARVKPDYELTAEEQAARERQHQQALAAAAKFEQAPERILPATGQTMIIHMVDDGLTAFGKVWYRGQEIEIGPDHPRWPEAVNWIMLSRFEQLDRWGKHFFDFGPWPGRRSYTEAAGSFEQLTVPGGDGTIAGPDEAALRQADEAERRRGRGVPAPAYR